jgi:8-oxo-dGTP pyrophosphatase MutT (NUDIX family)
MTPCCSPADRPEKSALAFGSFQEARLEWEESLARELFEELGITARIGKKVAESSYRYEHGNFRIVAYSVEWISGEPSPSVHDRLEWVKIDDLNRYRLLPADIPIAESLQKRGGFGELL